ncbi:hypothetical protein MPSEU_000980800 [Mayamaea pseudoterrestris]|nr:hypothetical protein MPSEU_000980800 [Mayamaea pseudoterrestris]
MFISICVTLSSLMTVLVAAGTAYLIKSHHDPCHGVELVWLPQAQGDEVSVNACDYFSDNYTQARERFQRAVQLIPSAKLESILIYKDNLHQESYYMDICILPGSQPGLVIHSSGVHGVEGYAGSAVQLALLDSPSFKTKHSDRPTLVLVHAVNPYGMAHYRRVNEHNVDLNRNALTKQEFESIHEHHNASHESYAKLQDLFNPHQAPSLWSAYASFWPRVVWNLSHHGLASIKAAMVAGQYYNDKGIFYGGSQLEPSTKLLEEWLTKYLSKHLHQHKKDKHDDASHGTHDAITWIDVHTGLGPSGRDTLLPGAHFASNQGNASLSDQQQDEGETDFSQAPSDKYVNNYAQQLQRWFPNSLLPTENSVASGYEQVKGLYGSYFHDLLHEHDANSLFFVQEFGTIPSIFVGHALMTENAAYQHGNHSTTNSSTSPMVWAKRTMLPAFYLQHPDWRRSVLQQGVRVAWQGLERTKFYSSARNNEGVENDKATAQEDNDSYSQSVQY